MANTDDEQRKLKTGNNDQSSLKDDLPNHIPQKIPYPKSVFFIVSNEFCERFCYYGMRTILALYLYDILAYSKSDATIIYHAFAMLVYFFPVFGAIIADSFLGKFNTILYLSMIYAAGNIVLALSAVGPLNLPDKGLAMLGLVLIALGSGGIKPCVSAFGGDQFVLPQQELQLAMFFSMYYFSINAGSLISTTVTPLLRERVHCFEEESCYSLAFGVPGILMIVSIVIFALGKPLYKIRQPQGNMVVRVSKAIGTAISEKSKSKDKKDHWLDYAADKHGTKLIEDIKATLKVLVLYIPLPVFWALFDQQGSAWTFQAKRMDGSIGFYTILPDQMQVANPLLILAFIPLFQTVIYPVFEKCNVLKTPLQRLVCGGVLAAVSFIISACIWLAIEAKSPVLPSAGNGQIRIYNTLPCDVTVASTIDSNGTFVIAQGDYYKNIDLELNGSNTTYPYSITDCSGSLINGSFNVYDGESVGYFYNGASFEFFLDDVSIEDDGLPRVRTLVNSPDLLNVSFVNSKGETKLLLNSSDTSLYDFSTPETYTVHVGNDFETEVTLHLGGVYSLLISSNTENNFEASFVEVTPASSIHMLLLLPQYIIITMAEIMFSITGLEFSYSQAPSSMKSVMQACWLLTTAFGNLIVIIIEAAVPFDNHSYNFFLYAVLMLVDMAIFSLMAMRYKYVENEDSSSDGGDIDLDPTKENGIDNPDFKKGADE